MVIPMCKKQIEEKFKKTLESIIFLKIIDESYRHKTLIFSKKHFRIILVSNTFIGKNLIDRHRIIYQILKNELSTTIHSLSLHIYTKDEWKKIQNKTFFSTLACRYK